MIKLIIKFNLLIFSFLFFNITNLYSEVIKEIKISGNDRVNSETIKIFSGVSIGDNLTTEDLNDILKQLYETNFFKDVNLKYENSILTVNVIENPIVQNLIIQGVKNKDLKKEIEKIIVMKEKNPLIDNKLQTDVNNVKNLIQEIGYYFSEIELLKKDNDNNTVDLIFKIDLGKKAYIKEILFVGDKKFKKRKLLNVITSEENKPWKFISSKRLVNKNRIELDKRLLLNFYKNKGYFEANILDESIEFDENQNFNLVFNIDSGEKFYFGKFFVDLPNSYDSKHFIKINEKLNSFSGEKYSLKVIEKMLSELEKIATSKQYDFLNAAIQERISDNNKIDVKISIIEEDKNLYVNKINIFGNSITIEDVIRNELLIDEGDPLNKVLFNKSVANIKSLNIFKQVETEIVDLSDDFQKDINIIVEEKPTGQISLGAGVGTSGTSTSFGVQENNFLGKGIKLNSNLFISEENIKGLFSYTKPNYNNSDKDLIFTVQSQETDRLADFGYKSNDTGFMIGTNYEYLEDLYFSPKFSVFVESLTTSSSASSLLKKQEGSYFDTTIDYSLLLDKRDQSYRPTDGFLSFFSQSIPLNVDENQTVVNGYELTTFSEYINDQILEFSFFAKAATSLGDNDVRISDRLYIPSRKLRGFESGRVGPIDGGDFVGGNYVASFNASAELPIFQSLETMDFNVFYDAANVWGVDYNSSINDSSALRSATGIGVDWYTPIGPLSFSFAQPLSKKSSDKTETFRFNLGTTF